jgi:hypothetical protein
VTIGGTIGSEADHEVQFLAGFGIPEHTGRAAGYKKIRSGPRPKTCLATRKLYHALPGLSTSAKSYCEFEGRELGRGYVRHSGSGCGPTS